MIQVIPPEEFFSDRNFEQISGVFEQVVDIAVSFLWKCGEHQELLGSVFSAVCGADRDVLVFVSDSERESSKSKETTQIKSIVAQNVRGGRVLHKLEGALKKYKLNM